MTCCLRTCDRRDEIDLFLHFVFILRRKEEEEEALLWSRRRRTWARGGTEGQCVTKRNQKKTKKQIHVVTPSVTESAGRMFRGGRREQKHKGQFVVQVHTSPERKNTKSGSNGGLRVTVLSFNEEVHFHFLPVFFIKNESDISLQLLA